VVECRPLVRQILEQGRKTLENLSATLQTAREDCERICDAYRMQGLPPVSVSTIILAALEVLKRTPELDEVIRAIVAADKRLTILEHLHKPSLFGSAALRDDLEIDIVLPYDVKLRCGGSPRAPRTKFGKNWCGRARRSFPRCYLIDDAGWFFTNYYPVLRTGISGR
jgi:hypothetical protein